MRDEWKAVQLGDVCLINPDRVDRGSSNSEIRYIDISSVGTGHLNAEPQIMTVADAPSRAQRLVRTCDVILSTVRPNRRSMLRVSKDLDECVASTGFAVLRAKSDHLDPGFLWAIVAQQSFTDYLVTREEGAAYPAVSSTAILEFGFSLPPLAEQRAIAATLGALDDKIELNRKMSATLEAMAQALFRDWFVDFGPTRTKVEVHAPYLSPDLWSLFPDRLDDEGKPEGWEFEPLLDQAEWVNGAAYKNMHFSDAPDALPVIKIAELKNGVTGNTQRTATDLGARYLINDGELLFSWSGNPDTSIDTFLWAGGKAWLNQHIFAVRQNGKRSKPYLHALLKFLKPEFAELARNKQTTGLGHVTKADMQRMMVCAAPSEVHRAFDRLIEPIFNQALGLQTETRTLAQTRDLLLPKLMSGELRVADLGPSEQETAA